MKKPTPRSFKELKNLCRHYSSILQENVTFYKVNSRSSFKILRNLGLA